MLVKFRITAIVGPPPLKKEGNAFQRIVAPSFRYRMFIHQNRELKLHDKNWRFNTFSFSPFGRKRLSSSTTRLRCWVALRHLRMNSNWASGHWVTNLTLWLHDMPHIPTILGEKDAAAGILEPAGCLKQFCLCWLCILLSVNLSVLFTKFNIYKVLKKDDVWNSALGANHHTI